MPPSRRAIALAALAATAAAAGGVLVYNPQLYADLGIIAPSTANAIGEQVQMFSQDFFGALSSTAQKALTAAGAVVVDTKDYVLNWFSGGVPPADAATATTQARTFVAAWIRVKTKDGQYRVITDVAGLAAKHPKLAAALLAAEAKLPAALKAAYGVNVVIKPSVVGAAAEAAANVAKSAIPSMFVEMAVGAAESVGQAAKSAIPSVVKEAAVGAAESVGQAAASLFSAGATEAVKLLPAVASNSVRSAVALTGSQAYSMGPSIFSYLAEAAGSLPGSILAAGAGLAGIAGLTSLAYKDIMAKQVADASRIIGATAVEQVKKASSKLTTTNATKADVAELNNLANDVELTNAEVVANVSAITNETPVAALDAAMEPVLADANIAAAVAGLDELAKTVSKLTRLSQRLTSQSRHSQSRSKSAKSGKGKRRARTAPSSSKKRSPTKKSRSPPKSAPRVRTRPPEKKKRARK